MSDKIYNKCENPWDIFHAFRKKDGKVTNSLHIKFPMYRAEAAPEKSKTGDQPLMIFNSFTRLVCTIISNGEFVNANISYDQIPGILDKLDYAKTKAYDREFGQITVTEETEETDDNPEGDSPAYTVTFRDGDLKGKSPAKVVLEGKEALLNDEYVRLKKDSANADIIEAIKDAAALMKEGKLEPQVDTSSKAFTVTISNGNLKGKTPAEVLQEEGGEKSLEKQKKWLQDNLEKYPANKKQIEAIDDAFALLKAGKISGKAVTKSKTTTAGYFEILPSEPKPLWRDVDNENLCPVNEISIVCDLSKNSPFIITIKNSRAVVYAVDKEGNKTQVTYDRKGDEGFLKGKTPIVDFKSKKDEKIKTFYMTPAEISELTARIRNAETAFLQSVAEQQIYEAVKSDEYNRTKRD